MCAPVAWFGNCPHKIPVAPVAAIFPFTTGMGGGGTAAARVGQDIATAQYDKAIRGAFREVADVPA